MKKKCYLISPKRMACRMPTRRFGCLQRLLLPVLSLSWSFWYLCVNLPFLTIKPNQVQIPHVL